MAAPPSRFDRMVPAAPDAVGALRRELRRWARRLGATAAEQANVALAFSEACTMIVRPEPDPREPGPLMVEAWIDGDVLTVRVSHRSTGTPAPPAEEVGYGFALALIARLCDSFEVRRRDDQPGTALLLTFSLEAPPAAVPQPGRSSPLRPSRSSSRR